MRSLSFLVCAVLFGSLSVALAQSDREFSDKLFFPPRLEIRPVMAGYYAHRKLDDSADWGSSLDVVIEEQLVSELYPLLTTLFFDRGSADPPDRYVLFSNAEERMRFTDTTIPGGTMQKYRQLLNVLGYRMGQYPGTTIRISAGYSEEPGESRRIAEERALRVMNYLTDIWGIDPTRISLEPIDEPYHDDIDSLLQEERRCVRIESDDWGIIRPIHIKEVRQYASPESYTLIVDPLTEPESILSFTIEAFWDGRLHRSLELPWHPDSSKFTMRWDWLTADEEDIPTGEKSILVRAVIVLRNGERRFSDIVILPVRTITRKDYSCVSGLRCMRYYLLLFPREISNWDAGLERALTEYVVPAIPADSRISLTGYSSTGERDSLMTLSSHRAELVAEKLRALVNISRMRGIEYKGVGSFEPLYWNGLPEGRAYNRTVGIIVEYPTKEEG